MTTDVKSIVLEKLNDHCAALEADSAVASAAHIDSTLVSSTPLKQLKLDSLAVLELVYDLEEHFSITMDSEELHKLITVGDLLSAMDNTISNAA